jgi:hypothetical protein
MRVCPICNTYSIASDNRCINCKNVFISEVIKSYKFLDVVRHVAVLLSVFIVGVTAMLLIYEIWRVCYV